jgi:UDP-GlcNAc:undecaprenyl-phosphate GlcNAc-1-phosphate transferase
VLDLAYPLLTGFVTTLCLTPLVRHLARATNLVAKPVADRWHERPTAMLGGVAVYAGFLVGGALALRGLAANPIGTFLSNRGLFGIIAAASLMFLVGLLDDKFKLRPATKLIGQGLAAAIVVSAGVVYPVTPWPVANVLATIFWVIAVTNALNLLDNMDGVAAGVAAVASLFLGVTFVMDSAPVLAGVCFALAGALLGFLPFNFRPASIFMGDSGSLFIGALLAGLGAAYPTRASASIVAVLFVPAVIVIIPILDTLLVTVARTLAGRPISVGGRDHTTHRLAAMGLSQRQVALLLYGFAACGGVLALVLRGAPAQLSLPIGAMFLVGLLIVAAYLSRLHSYEASARPHGRVTVVVNDLLHKRRAFEVLLDLILFAAAYQFAYLLRWDAQIPTHQAEIFGRSLALAVVAKSLAFGVFGVYRGHWHQLSTADVPRLAAAAIVGSLLTLGVLIALFPSGGYARSIFFIDGMLVALFTMGARVSFRLLGSIRRPSGAPALIYGAGRAGELTIREMLSNAELSLRPMGFIDDDVSKRGRLVQGYPVLGGVDDVPEIVRRWGIQTIVVGMRKPDELAVKRLRTCCEELGIDLLQLQLEFQSVTPRRNVAITYRNSGANRSLN